MNVLSLFSGIGGLDLGLQRAGMTICGQVEIDPWCRRVLAKHWPEVPRHDDVRTCAEWWGDRAVDLVCGGFPCQPVSWAGKGLAQDDERWLWPAFAGAVRHLRPRFVFVENVPGLLGRGMGDVLGDLAALGYDAEWDCIPAAHVGAPHIRDRVFIVAYPASVHGRPDGAAVPGNGERRFSLTAGERRPWGSSGGSRPPRDVPDTPGDRRPPEGQRPETGHANGSRDLRRQPQADHAADAARTERRSPQFTSLAPRVWTTEPGERPRLSGPSASWWASEPGVGRVAHGIPRRLDRLRGLGNAVVPQVAEHIGRMIMEAAA